MIIIGIVLTTLISKNVYSRQIQFFGNIQNIAGSFDFHPKKIISNQLVFLKHLVFDQKESIYEKYDHIRHFAHYDTALNIFKDYPIFGVGNRKFRFICHDEKYFNSKIQFTNERCSNHPHQVHLEILSEQGIVGYLIIIFAVFHVLLNSFIAYKKTKNIIHLSSILFVNFSAKFK